MLPWASHCHNDALAAETSLSWCRERMDVLARHITREYTHACTDLE